MFSLTQLHGKKQHIRSLLIDRVLLQHEVGLKTHSFSANFADRADAHIIKSVSPSERACCCVWIFLNR